ncbi:MAG: hypothetical protein RLY93_15205 [Sumerlaeia bacterium]
MSPATATKEEVTRRLDDWAQRLRALYAQVDEWRRELLPDSRLRIHDEPHSEPFLRAQGIKSYPIPHCTIEAPGRKIEIDPRDLWVIGAQSRLVLMVDRPENNYMIVDLAREEGMESEWQYLDVSAKDFHRPFNRDNFRKLLK